MYDSVKTCKRGGNVNCKIGFNYHAACVTAASTNKFQMIFISTPTTADSLYNEGNAAQPSISERQAFELNHKT